MEGWNFPTVPASALNINSASRPKEFGVTGYGVRLQSCAEECIV